VECEKWNLLFETQPSSACVTAHVGPSQPSLDVAGCRLQQRIRRYCKEDVQAVQNSSKQLRRALAPSAAAKVCLKAGGVT
jgi:hypothetical protein